MKRTYFRLTTDSYLIMSKLIIKHSIKNESDFINRILVGDIGLKKLTDFSKPDNRSLIHFLSCQVDYKLFLQFKAKCKKANMGQSEALNFILHCQ